MVERDLWAFFRTLELCQKAQLVMLAGSVTGKYYINEFLQRFAPNHGYQLEGVFKRVPGRGNVAWHYLSNASRRLPVFFCCSSPSGGDKGMLPKRIVENAERLKSILKQ